MAYLCRYSRNPLRLSASGIKMNSYFTELLEDGVPDSVPANGFDFLDLFDEYVASTQKTWAHDRTLSVGASEAFGCIRKNWFTKNGVERDPEYQESWGAMRRGDLIENHHVVPALIEGLRRRGMDLILAGEDQNTIVDDRSSATLDGLIVGAPRDLLANYGVPDIKSDSVVCEMKSFDPRINLSEEKAIHRGQAQMQMGLIRETTEHRPHYAVVLYVNASWLDDIRPFVVEWDERIYRIGRERNDLTFTVTDPGQLAPEGKLDGSCTYCPFTRACASVSVNRVPPKRKPLGKKEVDTQDSGLIEELDQLVHEAKALSKRKKEIERDEAAAREKVQQALIRANESRAVGRDWKVSYTTVAGRKTLSRLKMEEAGLDPADFEEEGAGYEKLTITVGGAEE